MDFGPALHRQHAHRPEWGAGRQHTPWPRTAPRRPAVMFLLIMEVLNALLRKADDCQLLQSLGVRGIALYANDLILFVRPKARDLTALREVFNLFEGASGLGCNLAKCQMVPIRCTEQQALLAAEAFPCQVGTFPIKYLGAPLSVTKLPKTEWQPLIDRVADRLPPWKGQLMNRSGRLELIRSTLTTMAIHVSICLGLPPWVIEARFLKLSSGPEQWWC
jgi:hypothetical protein